MTYSQDVPGADHFDFDRQKTLDWLRHLDLFDGVPAGDLELLLPGLRWLELHSGQEISDADGDIFIVGQGRLHAWHLGPNQSRLGERTLLEGDVLGIVRAIALTARPAQAVAVRDSGLAVISATAFRTFLDRSHAAALSLTRHFAGELTTGVGPGLRSSAPEAIALVALSHDVDLTAIAERIVRDTEALGLAVALLSHATFPHGAAELNAVQTINDLTVMVADGDAGWTALCLSNADRVVYVDAIDRDAKPEPPIKALLGRQATPPIDLVLCLPANAARPTIPTRWRDRDDVGGPIFMRRDNGDDLAFVARFVTCRSVGLVLAGGAARGYAHLGVVKALAEAGIPIDLIGGTSIGAILGAGCALQWDEAMRRDLALNGLAKGNPLGDYTVPIISLVRGGRMDRRIIEQFEGVLIEEMWRPFFCVSTNLSTCLSHVHRRGELWRAVRASAALPGIVPPSVFDGDIHVDGALLNNFPVDVMRAMARGPVIGVNIVPQRDFRSPSTDFTQLSTLDLIRKRSRLPVNLFELIGRTIQIGDLGRQTDRHASCDLLFTPPMDEFGLFDWKGFEAPMACGYAHATEVLKRERVTYRGLVAAAMGMR